MCRHKRLQLSNLRLRVNEPPAVCSLQSQWARAQLGSQCHRIQFNAPKCWRENRRRPGREQNTANFPTVDQSCCSRFVTELRLILNTSSVHQFPNSNDCRGTNSDTRKTSLIIALIIVLQFLGKVIQSNLITLCILENLCNSSNHNDARSYIYF